MWRCQLCTFCLLILLLHAKAQENARSAPDEISITDFSKNSSLITPGTGLIVLSDIGHAGLSYEENGWTVSLTRSRRLLILNKNGLEACTVSLEFSTEENKNRKLKSLKASTYNLVAGKIERTDLDPKQVFLAKAKNSELLTERFTMPNAKEGSVLEYSYTVRSSDVDALAPWYFQGDYPVMHSQYTVSIPAFFNYAITRSGKLNYSRKTVDSSLQNIWMGNGRIEAYVHNVTWEMNEIRPAQKEAFVQRPESTYSGLRFQISARPDRDGKPVATLRSWPNITNSLLNLDIFNERTGRNQKQIRQLAKRLGSRETGGLEKTKRIFHFVRDSFNCTHAYGWPDLGPAETIKTRSGNGGDLSLLLSTLLNEAGINARVLLLATRKNEPLTPLYPFPDNVNRLIVYAQIDNRELFLDAAHKDLAFGFLPPEYFNGFGINVDPSASAVLFDPDEIREKTLAEIDARINDSGAVNVSALVRMAEYNSYFVRRKIKEDGGDSGIFKPLAKLLDYTGPLNGKVEMADNADSNVNLRYTASIRPPEEQIIYLNGMLNHNLKNNPFPDMERQNAVEFEFPKEEIYDIVFNLPEKYRAESVPESTRIGLNEKDGVFEYNVTQNEQEVHIYCRMKINKTTFQRSEYDHLRSFYQSIIEKEGQMIVLKKK